MPDFNFYNQLRGKFGNEFTREFWQWLSQQDVQRPWWTKLGDEFTLRNYLQQMYQFYNSQTTAKPTTQPQAQLTTQPQQGWTVEKYLAAVNASLDADTVDKKVYDQMSDDEKKGAWAVGTEHDPVKEKERIASLTKTAKDLTLLPGWGEYRQDWVYLNGIVKVQGKLFQMPDGSYYDIDANPVSGESAAQTMSEFYKTNQNQMSDYEKASLEFDIAEAQRNAGQFQQTYGLQQQQLAEQRRQFDITQRRLLTERNVEADRREKELQFELGRERQLAGWSAPSDWIRRWQLKNQPNPYVPVMLTLQDRAEMGLQAIEEARQQMLQYQGTVPPEKAVLNQQGQWITPYEKRLEEITREWTPAIKEQQALAREAAESGEYPGSNRPPETPPAPAWLSQFAPGQAEGRPITAQNIVTPSGQQWARTPWSVREGVRGYAQWAQGKPYEEVIEEMESMLPFSPRGVASRRWIPTRQMV